MNQKGPWVNASASREGSVRVTSTRASRRDGTDGRTAAVVGEGEGCCWVMKRQR